ncbi:DNA cytosine methyltransferase [Shewanella sp. SP1S2-4]|uniref:DNA cytosine methyltransferase n=1 Tax=Shewanella sp. SP1S2-4 TaxID=3063537 RepID=UPI00288DE540|nr:DNA cytosine methyltransferase [Shewanella sp. SP1S2-4]MDT3322016.1 DNA cytosine methyltransferase [Shewanella sp. SP1S2-4]
MSSIELFAGAGGLALGMSNAGFNHSAIIEWNRDACETIRYNQLLKDSPLTEWPSPTEEDARKIDYFKYNGVVNVISGGPPCQPFSLGGKHQGFQDARDMFPEAVRAVRELQPKAFIFENVKGLMRSSFAEYFQYINLQLKHPELAKKSEERWEDHLSRLKRFTGQTHNQELQYNLQVKLLNAANFGVPQKRERVFFVGFRSDLNADWFFPEETHSEDELLISKWITGEYWDRHNIRKKDRPAPPLRSLNKLKKLKQILDKPSDETNRKLPWLTIRDTISDLPDPELGKCSNLENHVFIPGAKTYPGHTGSPIDEPSKTLKAGGHGVPGGENMLVKLDGSVRYFTVREAARIQTFPDQYRFNGSWTETMRQLGNAVPVKLAETVASSVAASLAKIDI